MESAPEEEACRCFLAELLMYLSFSFSFPYRKSKDQVDYFERTYKITENKSLEIQVSKWGYGYTLFGLTINPSWFRSHSGLEIGIDLFNWSLIVNLCDNRHWNFKEGRWCTPEEY